MDLNEAKNILKENGYLVESDNYVKDFTDEVIEPLDNIILGLKFMDKNGGEVDIEQLIKDLSDIKNNCNKTKNLLLAFKIRG